MFSASEQTGPANIGNRDIKLQYFDQYAQIWLENASVTSECGRIGDKLFFRDLNRRGVQISANTGNKDQTQYVVHYAQIWLENIGFKQNWTNEGKLFFGDLNRHADTRGTDLSQ